MKTFLMTCIIAAAVALNPNNGIAQEGGGEGEGRICGKTCVDCGLTSWEGIVDETHRGRWEQTCDFNPMIKNCSSCENEPPNGVRSNFISAMTIASTLEALQGDRLPAIYVAYSDRIRVNPKRHQVIITGTRCDKNADGAILNVKREIWAKLRELGAKTWEPTEK